ncbi:MAG: AsmA family protein [Rhodospirillales bacterium]|nr:AsmA family protein [Rhodospirillales bacterium]
MKRLLRILAVLPVLAIAAALAVPGLIDWTDHRRDIEAAVEEASGLTLSVGGSISVSLLPQPSLRLQDVTWSGQDGVLLKVPQIEADLSLGALLLGAVRVEFLHLVSPVPLNGREARLLDLARSVLDRPLLDRLEKIEVVGAAWDFDAGNRLLVDRLAVLRSWQGESESYRFELVGEIWDRPVTLIGRIQGIGRCGGTLAVELIDAELLPKADIVGDWTCAGEGVDGEGIDLDGRIEVRGPDLTALLRMDDPAAAEVSGLPFLVKGPFHWKAEQLSASDLELVLGEQAFLLTFAPVGGERIEAGLNVPFLQLDRDRAVSLMAVGKDIVHLLRGVPVPVETAIRLDNWRYGDASGGRSQLQLEIDKGIARLRALQFALPQAGSLSFEGEIGLTKGAPLSGRLALASEDLRGLLSWLGFPADALPSARLRSLRLESGLSGTERDFALSDLRIALDGQDIAGTGRWRHNGDSEISLKTGEINLDAYGFASLRQLAERIRGRLALSLTADRVTFAGGHGEGLDLTAALDGKRLSLPRLALQRLFGGPFELQGDIDFAEELLSLDASLAGVAAELPAALLPAWLQRRLETYALSLNLEGRPDAPSVAGELRTLGGEIFFSGRFGGAGPGVSDWALSLQHPDLRALLANFDLPLTLAAGAAEPLSLQGLLHREAGWALSEVTGRLGPVAVQDGSLIVNETGIAGSDIAFGPIDLDRWQWTGDTALHALLDNPGLPAGEHRLRADAVSSAGWALAPVALQAGADAKGGGKISLTAGMAEGSLEVALTQAGAAGGFNAAASALPLRQLLPSLADIAIPKGSVNGRVDLTWHGNSPSERLASLSGRLTAEGTLGFDLLTEAGPDMPPARLGQRLLQAIAGDAAGSLSRIANLTSGLVRLLEETAGRNFALALSLKADRGRAEIERAGLEGGGMLTEARGWADLAAWDMDVAWAVRFAEQGGEAYYRERRQGPLDAPDIVRDGLLFRGATPPR